MCYREECGCLSIEMKEMQKLLRAYAYLNWLRNNRTYHIFQPFPHCLGRYNNKIIIFSGKPN